MIRLCALFVTLASVSITLAQDKPLSLENPPASAPSTMPEEKPPVNVVEGLVEYIAPRLTPHEPMYFLYWPDSPDVKFQFSLKYMLLGPTNPLLSLAPEGSSLHIAYSQTTWWDISADSAPVYEHSFRPELLYLYQQPHPDWGGLSRFDLHIAIQHESNGRDGDLSRSLNIAYVKPVFTWGDPGNHPHPKNDWFIAVAPRIWAYLSQNEENPDIDDYRGHGDLRIIAGERGGIQVGFTGRAGDPIDQGAIQFDVSCPFGRIGIRNPDLYLYAQYFLGYGESLREYNESGSSFRVGLALVR
jgi:outer membrane phospholipase A